MTKIIAERKRTTIGGARLGGGSAGWISHASAKGAGGLAIQSGMSTLASGLSKLDREFDNTMTAAEMEANINRAKADSTKKISDTFGAVMVGGFDVDGGGIPGISIIDFSPAAAQQFTKDVFAEIRAEHGQKLSEQGFAKFNAWLTDHEMEYGLKVGKAFNNHRVARVKGQDAATMGRHLNTIDSAYVIRDIQSASEAGGELLDSMVKYGMYSPDEIEKTRSALQNKAIYSELRSYVLGQNPNPDSTTLTNAIEALNNINEVESGAVTQEIRDKLEGWLTGKRDAQLEEEERARKEQVEKDDQYRIQNPEVVTDSNIRNDPYMLSEEKVAWLNKIDRDAREPVVRNNKKAIVALSTQYLHSDKVITHKQLVDLYLDGDITKTTYDSYSEKIITTNRPMFKEAMSYVTGKFNGYATSFERQFKFSDEIGEKLWHDAYRLVMSADNLNSLKHMALYDEIVKITQPYVDKYLEAIGKKKAAEEVEGKTEGEDARVNELAERMKKERAAK